jgi:hypothetical protein
LFSGDSFAAEKKLQVRTDVFIYLEIVPHEKRAYFTAQ